MPGGNQLNVLAPQGAVIGVAGVNMHSLAQSVVGMAGHWGPTLRPHVHKVRTEPPIARTTLGDQAQAVAGKRAVYLLDYTYIACTAKQGGMRWAKGFAHYFSRENRAMPLVIDSAAFREFKRDQAKLLGKRTGAPNWSDYSHYCQAIDVLDPDAAMAKDVIGDQRASRENYLRMRSDGYGSITIPVWQIRQLYDVTLSPAENGRIAGRDPILRWYADQAPMVAIGGMVKSVIPRSGRGAYLAGIAEALPGVRLWGLGQASGVVVNDLGQRGLLDRVSVDGSWWINSATTEQIVILKDGLLSNIILARTGARSFFTFTELMASNLRALLSAYAGLWNFPGPARVPINMNDPDERNELKRRASAQLAMFDMLALMA